MDEIPILTSAFASYDHRSHTYLENTSISRVKKKVEYLCRHTSMRVYEGKYLYTYTTHKI